MFNNILNGLKFVWDTYLASYEGIAIGVIILAVLLKGGWRINSVVS